jgi:hypothetical protein
MIVQKSDIELNWLVCSCIVVFSWFKYTCYNYPPSIVEIGITSWYPIMTFYVQLNPTEFCIWLHVILRVPVVRIWSNPTNLSPGHGAAPLHCSATSVPEATFPVIGPHVMPEIWNKDVSQPPGAPENDVRWVLRETWSVTLTRVKSRNASNVATTLDVD